MEKKEKLLPQLLVYAGKRKVLTYLSLAIAGLSQLLALAPFLYIWAILRDVIAGDYSRIAANLAHQLPDKAGMYATIVGLAVLMFLFDWRMGLLCLATVVLALIVMISLMTGPMDGSRRQRDINGKEITFWEKEKRIKSIWQ